MPSRDFERHNIAYSGSSFDEVMDTYENYQSGYMGNPPSSEAEYDIWLAKFPNVFDGTPPVWTEVETKMAADIVKKNRAAAYPDWSLQLEKIYDDGLTKWKSEMVDPVKAKYPKP
jgi:hypothetical protein